MGRDAYCEIIYGRVCALYSVSYMPVVRPYVKCQDTVYNTEARKMCILYSPLKKLQKYTSASFGETQLKQGLNIVF